MPLIEYNKRENFHKVIKLAIVACENSKYNTLDDFPEARKIVKAGTTSKTILDYKLSRYACYLIAQNADSRKMLMIQ